MLEPKHDRSGDFERQRARAVLAVDVAIIGAALTLVGVLVSLW
jgi:hypothetical protein